MINNILEKNKNFASCNDNQLLFGYLEFKSKKKDLNFLFDNELNEYVPQRYKSEILTFIRKKPTVRRPVITSNPKYDKKSDEPLAKLLNLSKNDEKEEYSKSLTKTVSSELKPISKSL